MVRVSKFVLAGALSLSACRARVPDASPDQDAASLLSAEDETTLPEFTPTLVDVEVDVKQSLANLGSEASGMALLDEVGETAGDRYFFTIYGFQGSGPFNLPRYSHTFALYLRSAGPDLAAAPLDAFVISWDAADGTIGILQPPERGHNYTMAETLSLADSLSASVNVRRSRIYEIRKPLYDRALARYRQIVDGEDSGRILYRMTDTVASRRSVLQGVGGSFINCIAAVADVVVGGGGALLDTGVKRGFSASETVLQWYMASPDFVSATVTHDQALAPRLGI